MRIDEEIFLVSDFIYQFAGVLEDYMTSGQGGQADGESRDTGIADRESDQ